MADEKIFGPISTVKLQWDFLDDLGSLVVVASYGADSYLDGVLLKDTESGREFHISDAHVTKLGKILQRVPGSVGMTYDRRGRGGLNMDLEEV